jgi:hypothetical protein
VRLHWLEGKILRDLGRASEAEAEAEQVTLGLLREVALSLERTRRAVERG